MQTRRAFLQAAAVAGAARGSARKVEVIAHRGEHIVCPENTIPAIEKAIAAGAGWVEIDVRTTSDGKWVLMHDSTVDATTDGKGAVAEMEFAEIAKLDAGARKSGFRGTPVPSFDQALETMRGRCGLYLDAKRISAQAILDHLRRHQMMDRCVVYGGLPLQRELTALGAARLTMPEATSPEVLKRILEELSPGVIAFDRRDFRDDLIKAALDAGKRIFVDRLGADDNQTAWEDAVSRGAAAIQTDHPAELAAFLSRTGRR
ncbi:MAG: glycerophosphodiester phosphodiesterase family protein [Bryobacteraceae bacterium]